MAKKGKVATKAFMDRQVSARRVYEAAVSLGLEATAAELEKAYNTVEIERERKLDNIDFLKARLAELEAAQAESERHAA